MNEYETARNELRDAELALMQQREAVAAQRRALPLGPLVDDYEFATAAGPVRLSELVGAPGRPLVLYHFMLGKQQEEPCPMCAMWVDGWAGVAEHIGQRLDLALVSSAAIDRTTEVASARGWTNLRWLSAADNTFKADIGGEDDTGGQLPFLSCYQTDGDGIRLTYAGEANICGEHWRGIDLLSPVWHMLDLTPQGRGDWIPSLAY